MSLRKLRQTKGFTLIELMIVVAIIGILAAIAIPKFADLVTKSKEASTKGTLGSLRSAVSIYYGDTEGIYPGNLFVAITSGAKYMPNISGVASLGVYNIPANASNSNGHGTVNASRDASVLSASVTSLPNDGASTAPLFYNSTSSVSGEVYINCTHADAKGSIWTSF